jgi:hypothetical protein
MLHGPVDCLIDGHEGECGPRQHPARVGIICEQISRPDFDRVDGRLAETA